jgi:hypothetical protein
LLKESVGAELVDHRAQASNRRSKASRNALLHASTVLVRRNIEVSFANQVQTVAKDRSRNGIQRLRPKHTGIDLSQNGESVEDRFLKSTEFLSADSTHDQSLGMSYFETQFGLVVIAETLTVHTLL